MKFFGIFKDFLVNEWPDAERDISPAEFFCEFLCQKFRVASCNEDGSVLQSKLTTGKVPSVNDLDFIKEYIQFFAFWDFGFYIFQ